MIGRMFSKSVLIVALAGFVTFAVYGFVVHAVLLADMYNGLPGELWRTEAESQAMFHWIFIAYALMAWVMATLRPDDLTGAGDGFMRGALVGVLVGSVNLINYAIQPLTLASTLTVFAADIIMFALVGAVMALIAGKVSS